MSKLVTIAILCFSICLLGVGIALHTVFQDYRSLSNPQINETQDGTILENQKYLKLKTINNYPIVGVFFSQPYIKEVTKRKDWSQVIQQSSKALDSIVNARSYRIWYYRAIAECALLKFQQCQKSLYQSQFLAPKTYISKINQLKRVFNYKFISNLEQRQQQIAEI